MRQPLPGARNTSVSGIARTASRELLGQRGVLRGQPWSLLVQLARSAAAAASAAGTFSNPVDRSSTRSSPGNGLRQRAPLRTSSTPDAGGTAPLVRGRRRGRPAVRQREPAGRGAGVHEHAARRSRRRPRRPAGTRRPPGWRTGGRGRPARRADGCDDASRVDATRAGPPAPSRTGPRDPACQRAGVEHRRVLDGRGQQQVTLPGTRRRAGRARRGGTACVPLGVNTTSSGRTSRHSATTARALSSISRASRAGRCRRRGSAYPRSRACRSTSRAAGCSGCPEAWSRYGGPGRPRRPRQGPERLRSQGKTYPRPARRPGVRSVVGFRMSGG